MTKTCSVCKETMPIESFVICRKNKDGYSSRCKECHKIISKKYVENNREKRLESSRNYYKTHKTDHRNRVYDWRERNPEKVKEIKKKTRIKNAHKIKEYTKLFGTIRVRNQRLKYPEKYKARNKVNNAIAGGKLAPIKTLSCTVCNKAAEHYHHHKGYEEQYWLDVVPVCTECHHILEKNVV